MLTKDLVVLVTGAGQGIGRATAMAFAREGASAVVVADINEANAAATAECISAFPHATGVGVKLDVTDRAAVGKAVDSLVQRFSRIDVLINNAGICLPKAGMAEITPEDWHRAYDINVVGMANCISAVIPHMLAKQSGRIVSLSSLSAYTGGLAVSATYSCSKAAVICMTKAAAKEYAASGIRVNAVAPGFIRTPMTAGFSSTHTANSVPLGRLGEPEDVADAIIFLASDYSRYITGTTLDVNGGIM